MSKIENILTEKNHENFNNKAMSGNLKSQIDSNRSLSEQLLERIFSKELSEEFLLELACNIDCVESALLSKPIDNTYLHMICICCKNNLSSAGYGNQPSGGIIFRSNGNYGSVVFDPTGPESDDHLELYICDSCAIKNKYDIYHYVPEGNDRKYTLWAKILEEKGPHLLEKFKKEIK